MKKSRPLGEFPTVEKNLNFFTLSEFHKRIKRPVPEFTKKSLRIYKILFHLLTSLSFNLFPIARINRMELHASSKCSSKQDHRAAIEVEARCIGKHISLLRVANCKRGCWSSWNIVVSRRLLLQARQGEQRILVNFHQ